MSSWEELWADQGLSLPWILDKPEKNLLHYFVEYDWPNTVLDIGCGHGYHASVIGTFCENVTGIDISDTAISLAKSLFPKIDFICKDILEYNSDIKYDLIYDKGCLHHIESLLDKHRYMRRMTELLSDNGYWLCIAGKVHDKEELYKVPQISLSQMIKLIELYLDIVEVKSTVVPAVNNIHLPAWKIIAKKYDK